MSKNAYRYDQPSSHLPSVEEEFQLMVEDILIDYEAEARYLVTRDKETEKNFTRRIEEFEAQIGRVKKVMEEPWNDEQFQQALDNRKWEIERHLKEVEDDRDNAKLISEFDWADLRKRRDRTVGHLYALLRGAAVPAPLPDPFYRWIEF